MDAERSFLWKTFIFIQDGTKKVKLKWKRGNVNHFDYDNEYVSVRETYVKIIGS